MTRTLWHRLFPIGGRLPLRATRAEPDPPEQLIPGGRPLRVHWLGYRPEPRRFGDGGPGPTDLDQQGRCWWWMPVGAWFLDQPLSQRAADALWLPYRAIADPDAP